MADDLATAAFVLRVLRRSGVGFDDAWPVAFPPNLARPSRTEWRHALSETRDAWARAYSGEPPSPGEAACTFLGSLWAEPGDSESIGKVVASRCG